MVATVKIVQLTGTAGSESYHVKTNTGGEVSSTRYMTSDQWDGSLDTYPIPIPTTDSGISGSYWVTHCLQCTVAPSTYCKNVKYYQTWTNSPKADWALGSSSTANKIQPGLYIGVSSNSVAACRNYLSGSQGFPTGSYVQATGVEETFGYYISGFNVAGANGAHTYYSGANRDGTPLSGGMVSISNFDSQANAICVQSGSFVTDGSVLPKYSYCIVTQVLVGSGATQGEKTDKTATFVYTEV